MTDSLYLPRRGSRLSSMSCPTRKVYYDGFLVAAALWLPPFEHELPHNVNPPARHSCTCHAIPAHVTPFPHMSRHSCTCHVIPAHVNVIPAKAGI